LRVVHIESLPEWVRNLFHDKLPSEINLLWSESPQDVHGADVIVSAQRCVSASLIETAGPSLRLIQIQGRAPWAVDWSAAASANVPVSSIPHRGAIAVAEHAMALMLGVARKIVTGHVGTTTARYRDLGIDPIRTDERTIAFNWLAIPDVEQLYGKTLGLVGLGDIGLEVARRARAFDMDICYHKRHRLSEEAERMAQVRYAELDELFATSDVVSVHAPHTPETERLVDEAALGSMRSHAVLVNTARGGLVDEEALVRALRNGVLAGAGLDVFIDEPLPAGHPLLELDNVLLSPHVGGGTGGGQRAMVADVIENLMRLSRGDPLLHVAERP
jgi:lactate dehydrogenase-like 2-hydroxyacid dehydrogenase